jgi:hypothetical protein
LCAVCVARAGSADPDGSVVLVVPEDHPVTAALRRAADCLPALLDATDVCPVPVADQVRGRARLVGWVHEPPAHLRRELALVAADREGAGALLDIGRGRTVLYVDVAEVQFVDGGADPDEVAVAAMTTPRLRPTRSPTSRRRCSATPRRPPRRVRPARRAAAGRPAGAGRAGPARAAAAGRRHGRPAALRRAADLPAAAAETAA